MLTMGHKVWPRLLINSRIICMYVCMHVCACVNTSAGSPDSDWWPASKRAAWVSCGGAGLPGTIPGSQRWHMLNVKRNTGQPGSLSSSLSPNGAHQWKPWHSSKSLQLVWDCCKLSDAHYCNLWSCWCWGRLPYMKRMTQWEKKSELVMLHAPCYVLDSRWAGESRFFCRFAAEV